MINYKLSVMSYMPSSDFPEGQREGERELIKEVLQLSDSESYRIVSLISLAYFMPEMKVLNRLC